MQSAKTTFWTRLKSNFKGIINPPVILQQDTLHYWRVKILSLIFITASVLGLIAYIPALIPAIQQKNWGIIIVDSIVFGFTAGLVLIPAIPFKIRAAFIVCLFYAIGVTLLFSPYGYITGPLWLFAFPVVTATLHGFRPALIALAANTLVLLVSGIFLERQILIWGMNLDYVIENWVIISINFIILNSIVTISISSLVRGMKHAVQMEKRAGSRLQNNREKLIRTNVSLNEEMEERKRIEEALRLNEEKYRVLVELSSDAIFILTITGIVLDCNAAACDIFGYGRDEMMGMDVTNLIPDQFREHLPEIITEDMTTGDNAIERYYQKKDGTVFATEITTKIFEVAGQKRLLAYVRDITQRKWAEAELRESEQRFRTLADNVPGAIYMCRNDERYTMLYLNNQVEQMTGYPKSEFLMDRISFVELYHPDDIDLIYKEVDEAIAAKRPFHLIYRIKDRSGKWRWIEEFGVGVFDETGENLQFIEGFLHDITNRKTAEESLQTSEERLNLALEATSDGLWDWDVKTGRAYFGPRYYTMLGYLPEEFPATYESFASFLYPPDREAAEKTVKEHVESGSDSYEIEFRMCRKDGSLIWILSRGKVVERDENGHPIRMVGTHIDITARKQAEDEIKSQAAFASNNPSPVIQAGLDGAIIRYNPSAEELFNRRLENENIHDLFPQLSDVIMEGELPADQLQFEQEFGGLTTLFTLKKDLQTQSLYIYGIDITARKRAEEAQKILLYISEEANSADNLNMLLQIVHDKLSLLVDTTNFYVALYEPADESYSLPIVIDEHKDIVPESLPLQKGLTGFIRRTGKPLLVDKALHQKLVDEGEIEPVGPTAEIWMGVPLKTSGIVSGVMVLQHYENPAQYTRADLELMTFLSGPIAMVIERKRREEEWQKMQEKLERAERMESLGILAGGVAHDLNNMLGPLVGYPELLLQKLPDDSPLRKHVERIGKAANEAAEVIQDLLTLARRGRYEMHPLNLNEVVENYMDSPSFTKLKEDKKNIEVILDLDHTIENIIGSEAHLSKVIMNLILNACDAMEKGGKLYISTTQQYIERLYSGYYEIQNGKYILLKVKDTGKGIDEKELKKIFEPYYSKKKMGISGSGLGLSVVYGIVKDHKGYYDVFSKVGKGTEFLLYFPVTLEAKKEKASDDISLEGTESVLVIDDVEEQRQIAEALLSNLGYNVSTASSGQEAVEYLQENKADIVLIDMIMEAGFGGLETYREILKIHPGQKAVIVSGFSRTEDVIKMQQMGAGQYIKKPYNLQNLARAIREELDKFPQKVS